MSDMTGLPSATGCLNGLPYAIRRRGHVEARHAARRERIENGIHHRRRRADRACLTATLDAERIVSARRPFDRVHLEAREVGSTRHRVVGVASGEQLPVGVVDTTL